MLQGLRAADRPATPDEQVVLARWSGWGAVPQLFDLDGYAAERAELQRLLTRDEYGAARRSTVNAHYTDAALVRVIWDAVQGLGFTGGVVLEPGCGSGHFIGLAPPSADMVGVEREPISAGVAAALYPRAEVVTGSFADVWVAKGSVDAVVGNVPFAKVVLHDPRHNSGGHSIHNHFLIKALHLTRPGGIVAILTSRYTMDAVNPAARAEMARLADLVGAVRLPTGAHRRAAGTDAVTDLLILRRREPDAPARVSFEGTWEKALPTEVGGAGELDEINRYFLDHPENVLGEFALAHGMHGRESLTVVGDPAAAPVQLAAAVERITAAARDRGLTMTARPSAARSPRPAVAVNVIDPAAATFRGFLTAHPDGSFTERGRDHDLPYVPSAADADELRMLIGLRDVTMALVRAEQASIDDTPQMDVLRGQLNRDYDAYVARFGPIRRFTQRRQLRQAWHVFSEWCDRHERDRLPTNADTVRDYLSDLAHRGVGQDQLRRHLDGIAKAHVTAQTRQVRKAAATLLDGLVADGAERDTATEMVTRLTQDRPDELLTRAGVTPIRFAGEALDAGQEVITAAPASTSPDLDLDELGLRTTVIRRPPQGGFRTSPFAAVVRALEKFDPTTQTAWKALIFTQRVINPPPTRLGASTPEEALSICLDTHSRVDLPEIARLLGLPDAQHARAALGELVYDDPHSGEPIWRRTYLAGNVRQKLAQARLAAEGAPALAVNVAALEQVVPADLGPEDIEIRLGSWIGAAYVRLFLREVLDDDTVVVEQVGGLWGVAGNKHTVAATQLWGGGGLDVFALTEKLLVGSEIKVMRTIEVPGPRGDLVERQVLDPEATEEAKDKAVEIGDRFADWVWEDTARAQDLIDTYNALFNSEIPPDFSGVELSLPGLSAAYSLREHQRTAIARIIYQPGTGLVHDVGAGKTLEMIVGVMERRRRGLSVTPVVVVPNDSIADQFEREWMLAYPSARLLAATSADLGETTDGAGRRAEAVARIATDDWDAVIMTKEAFQRIPLHAEAQEKFLAAELDDLRAARDAARGELSQTMTKRVETAIEQAEERLKRRLDEIDRDNAGVTFRDSGIDLVVVDEAQTYKNGMLISSLPGLAIEGADRSLDLDMKLAWLAEQHGGPRCVLATATPFTNSFGEVYLWQRRLGHQMPAFDVWARTCCTSEAFMEMTPGGTLRARSRMRRVINEPELWRALRLTTDIKMQEDLNLPVPARRGGAVEILTVPAAPEARIFTLDLARRERNLTGKPEKGADNPLVIQHDGTLVALDVRTVGLHTDHPQKVDHVADDIHAEWSAARDTVYLRDDGTEHPIRGGMILVFCDESTPGKNWNFYGELKRQLVARGMDENSIRFIHEAGSSVQRKADLLAAGREGAISVLVGSTMKMGAGINVQDRLIGGYELTGPWRADTSAQAEGRIRRRGNQNPEYFWKRVVTAPSMDARKWETTGQKHNMFAPMLSSTPPSRTREITDDQSVGLADVMAAATGDPRYREKAELDQEHTALTRRRSAHARTQQSLKLTITSLTARIPQRETLAARQDAVATRHVSTRGDAFRMDIAGTTYNTRTEAADALKEFLRSRMAAAPRSQHGHDVPVGTLGGYRVSATLRPLREFSIGLMFPDAAENSSGLAFDHRSLPERHGLITRLENELDGILDAADRTRAEIAADHRSLEQARSGVGTPFPHADRLEVVSRRRAELITELSGDLDNDHTELDPDSPEAKARAERIEARHRDHAAMTTAAQQHAARRGNSAAYANTFAAWYVAIAADVTADQRPDLATAHTVWNDLNHPTATTRGSSKPGPPKASDTADVAPEPLAPIAAPAPLTTGPVADDQADDGQDPGEAGAKTGHSRAAHRSVTATEPPSSPGGTQQAEMALHARITTAAAQWFEHQLDADAPAAADARQYLADRLGGAPQLDRVRGRGFCVGYAPAGWTTLTDHLRARGFRDDDLIAAGVATVTSRNTTADRFRNRIMFGIRDADGRMAGFIGRALSDTDKAKYLNSPASPLFDKSTLLFGWSEQQDLAGHADPVFVEGPLDVLALIGAADAQHRLLPVAACGTALTTGHLDAVDVLVPPDRRRVFAFDGDAEGRKAALARAVAAVLRYPDLHITTLPDNLDPAGWALAVEVDEHLAAYLGGPHTRPALQVLVDARVALWQERLQWAEGRLGAARDVAQLLATVDPGRVVDLAVTVATRLQLDPAVMAEFVATARHHLREPVPPLPDRRPPLDEVATETPDAEPGVTSGAAADDAHPGSAPPDDKGTAAPDPKDAAAQASVVVSNDQAATVPDPRTQPSPTGEAATGASDAPLNRAALDTETPDAAGQDGRVEPGPWSRRIAIALVGDSATVSGTSRDDPAVLRTALKEHFGWRPKEGAVWKYVPRRHGVDRDTAVATIRQVLIELDAQATAQTQPAPSHPPTPQQQAIIDACLAGRDVAVRALAGTGKTSTLRMVAARLPDKKITYIAFNRSIADEAQAAFGPSVVADTMHAFARQALRAHPIYRAKLATIAGNDGYPSEVAAALGLDADRSVTYGRHGQIDATDLVRRALGVVKRFRESADPRIGPEHLGPEAVQSPDGLTDLVLDVAGRIWADKTSRDGRLRFTHDDYLKVWALAEPRIPGDVIFFDEVQDVSAVQAAVVQSQPVQTVVVGDSFQSIYGFRGARDFLRTWPADVTLSLTQSWRFGPAVADLGNRFLGLLHGTLQLEGNPALDSRLGQVANPDAVLCRTNTAAVTAVFSGLEAGKRVALVGGGAAIKDIARAAQDLQRGRRTRHPDLSTFANWDDVRDYVEQHDDAQSLRTFVRLVDKHQPEGLIALADRLTDEAEADPGLAAELVVSTSHKAKGREWNTVRIADDYPRPTEDADTGQLLLPSAEDLRLAYVTVTRAQHRLDLGSLDWILDPTYLPSRTAAVAQPAAGVAPRDVPAADPVVADAAVSLAPPAAVASVSAQHPARGNTSGVAHPAAQDTADPYLELDTPDPEAAELTDRDLAVTVLGLTGNQFAAMVRGLDDDEPALASGYWSRRRPLDLPDAGALESVKHNAKGFVIEIRTATTVRAGRASWERVNDWLRAGLTPGTRRVLFAADAALTRFQQAEPGFLAAGHLELCDRAQRELDGHLDQARRAIVDRALAARQGIVTRSRRRRSGTAPHGADPLTPVGGPETIDDQIDVPATDQAALDRIDTLATILPWPGREIPVSQIEVGAVVQHPDHPDRAFRITAAPVTRADGVELVGVLMGVPGGHDSPARWSVANSDHADPTIDLVPLPVLEGPLVAAAVAPIASADRSPASDNDLGGRMQVPDDLDLTAAGWTRAEIGYHQQGPVERWTRDGTELVLRWTSTDDDLLLTTRVLVNGTDHVIESVADLRTIVNEAGRVGTARFDGQSTVTAGLTAAAAAPAPDAESDQPATGTGPTADASKKESTAWRPGDLFEWAVAEGRRAIAETAAAGGHKPAAWLAFSGLVRTDPTSGIAYSAVEPEAIEVARWWIDQATAALAELGYRVEYRPPQGRRSRRARQVEVDHDARLVVLDASQPPALAVGFTLVAEVARLRGAAGDVGGQAETQAVSVDPDLEPTAEPRAAGDTADLASASSAADTQQPELPAQATLFDLTPTPPSRNDARVRAITGTPTKAANRVDEHPPVPSTNPAAGAADRGSTTNEASLPRAALTDVDIALALRHQFGVRLAEFVQAMGTPGAPLTSIVHAGRVGNRNADESDAGAHERIDATTRNLTIDVRTTTEHRTGTLTWSKVATWLRAGLDPVDVRVLLDAYRAHYRFYVNSTGFEVIGERDLAANAGDELKAMAGAAAERILDRAVRTHAAGEAPRRWSGRGPDPLARPALDGELPAAEAAQLARVAALSTVLPDRVESSVDLADVQVGDVLVDWRNSGDPFRVRMITDHGDTVDLIGEVITSWRGAVADTMTVHKNSQFGTPMTMLLMAIPASLASLSPLHTEQTTAEGAGRADPAMPAVPQSLAAVVDPPPAHDAAVIDRAAGGHHDPDTPKGRLAIEAISLVQAATVDAPTLREQFAALPMPTLVRVHEPARLAFNQARRILHEPDVTPTQRARVIINLGSERSGEAAAVAEQLDALAAMVDASGHHQLVDATLPFAEYLRQTSNEIRRQTTSGSAAPAAADLPPRPHSAPTPAAAVEASDRTTDGPAGAPGEIESSPELVTPALTHLVDVDPSPSTPEKPAPVDAGSVEPEPVDVPAGADDRPDDPAGADDPALHWSGLVARAAGHGFGVHTTYTGESRIDGATATIHIAAGQPPLSRLVDLALKVGELAVRDAGIESVPAEQFEPQLPTRSADDPASLRWPAGQEMSEPVSSRPGRDLDNGHDQSGASARNGWSAYPWEVPEPRAEMDTPIFDQLRADPPLATTSLPDPPWYPVETVQDHTPIFERLWREMGLLADPTAAPVIAPRKDGAVGPPNAHAAGRAGLPGSPSARPGSPRTAGVAETVGSGRARGRQ